ncbi:MAG: hypothetical protein M1817_000780 [Caeruleum heppii]|nr:MAG: hypothetical protein M1817_000780 [Caeruleum heppii]
MSPRRSFRARTSQPSAGPEQHPSSSSSTTSSARADRNTRSQPKQSSPRISQTPRSQLSEELDDPTMNPDAPHTRRRRRADDEPEEPLLVMPRDHVEDGEEEEEEVTRCVCGQQDYPGPPNPIAAPNPTEAKDDTDANATAPTATILPEDSGGLFIQCDICKVWQHGGCVGIMEESMSPDEYYCELCRKDLHKISVGPRGQRYSRYRPVGEAFSPRQSRATSRPKETDPKMPSERSKRLSTSALGKRRSTMNSRDAAYDEEEQFRRAIEESRAERTGSNERSSRRAKRSRSESEETRQDPIKRQRTASGTPSTPAHPKAPSTNQKSASDDEDASNKQPNSAARKIRGAAAKNQREKELREREREKERNDAAGRRKGRAEKRGGDESDPSDEIPLSQTASLRDGRGAAGSQPPPDPPASSQPPADSPPNHHVPSKPDTRVSHRKGGRPPARKGRVGRNQYTRDRDLQHDQHALDLDESPARSQSRDGPHGDDQRLLGNHPNGGGTTYHSAATTEQGTKPSRPRYMHPHRTSMNEMKRRVAAILEFISRTQVEMAGERTPPSGSSNEGAATAMLRSLADGVGSIMKDAGGSDKENVRVGEPTTGEKEGHFAELSSLEMMDVLTRKLVLWQREFGKWGEK